MTKRAPKKKPTKGGRPGHDPKKIARALKALERGKTPTEAAKLVGISVRAVYRARAKASAEIVHRDPKPAKKSRRRKDDEDDLPKLDPDASPLHNAKALLEHQLQTLEKLHSDSPRMNPAHANARAYIKLIATLEREQAGDESPDQKTERLRLADAETRKMLEGQVLAYETQAERDGVCLHCDAPLADGATRE
jgi:Homeodomain-like domain